MVKMQLKQPKLNGRRIMAKDKVEICSIRIMFPVKSDEEAIAYKKKIADILSDNPDAQTQFSLMTPRPPVGAT